MDYQRQKNNKYILPQPVYNQVIWILRDYHRMKDEAESLLYPSAVNMEGMPKGNSISSEVESKAIKREELLNKVRIIDDERAKIPNEYAEGVWNNLLYRTAYPMYADRTTYARYKSKFIYKIAERLYLI